MSDTDRHAMTAEHADLLRRIREQQPDYVVPISPQRPALSAFLRACGLGLAFALFTAFLLLWAW